MQFASTWWWAVLAASGLLAALAAYLVWKVPRRRPLRALLYAVAIASLAVLGLQPYRSGVKKYPPDAAILLSSEVGDSTLALLLDTLSTASKVYALEGVQNLPRPAVAIPDLAYLLPKLTPSTTLYVLGTGLQPHELPLLRGKKVHFLLSPPNRGGLLRTHWARQIDEGKPLEVFGAIIPPENGNAKLVLLVQGIRADSLLLPNTADTTNFLLTSVCKQAGYFVDSLLLEDRQGNRLFSNPLPYQVNATPNNAVAILLAQPSFETKFLKNHLAGLGYGVAVRTTLSREQSRLEFTNLPDVDLDSPNFNVLSKFDLLVMDQQTAQGLGKLEVDVIFKAADRNGLGVLVLADGDLWQLENKESAILKNFEVQSFSPGGIQPTVHIPNGKLELNVDVPLHRIKLGKWQKPLLESKEGVFAAFRPYGLGKLGLSLLPETYKLALSGRREDYAALWGWMLENMLANYGEDPVFTPRQFMAFENEFAGFGLAANPPDVEIVWQTPDSLAYRPATAQTPAGDSLYFGILPEQPGWHSLQMEGRPAYRHYVFAQADWQGLRKRLRYDANRRFALKSSGRGGATAKNRLETERLPVPLLPFYVLLVLALGGLWLEGKFQ